MIEFDWEKIGPAITGAAVAALKFWKGRKWYEVAGMLVGGASMSFYCGASVAEFFSMQKAIGPVYFFVGVFGMALVDKAYEVLAALDAKQIAADGWNRVSRIWKA